MAVLRRQQLVDFAGDLDPAQGHQDQVVGHALELGKHVRGEQYRHALIGSGRQDGGHELVPCDRVEHRHGLVEHEELRVPSQGQRQRELRLLSTGQSAGLPLERDAELGSRPSAYP